MRLETRTALHAGVIEVFDNAVTNCEEIVRYTNLAGRWGDAVIGHHGGEVDKTIRNNNVAFLHPNDYREGPVVHAFARVIWHYLDDYAKRYDVTFSAMESINVNRYEVGQEYHVHADAGPYQPRVISALVYLNDVESGGETYFPNFNLAVTPKEGRLVIFPSNYAYAHAALPPHSGVKYSAAFWTIGVV